MLPILLTIHLLTFSLFFVVNNPDDIARIYVGQKYSTPEDLQRWKQHHGFDKPLFYNQAINGIDAFVDTVFFHQTQKLLKADFGLSLYGENINEQIKQRILPSLSIALPAFILGLLINLMVAIFLVFFRHTQMNHLGLVLTVCFLSVSTLFYIIFAQHFFAFRWNWLPISGYAPGILFVLLPIIVHIFSGLGGHSRWYRTFLMEEIEQPYIITARASGLHEWFILVKYALRNAMLPITTGVVVIIPSLFLGSILYESFFSIPGLGNYLIDALRKEDFAVVQAMVILGAVAYLIGLVLTDIIYGWVDPRVRIR